MTEWSVQLCGDKFDLEDFPKWFKSPDFQVVEETDGYYLKSIHFEHLTEASSVRTKANELIEIIIGIAKLSRPNLAEIKLGSITETTQHGKRKHHIFLASSINIRSKVSSVTLLVDGKAEPNNMPRPTQWALVAEKNQLVRQALQYWVANHKEWNNLYKILEVIESDVGGEIYNNNWVTKPGVKRFTQTANSYSALGNKARHAKNKIPSPAKPMNIKEATNFIKALLEKWIDSKK